VILNLALGRVVLPLAEGILIDGYLATPDAAV